LEPLTRTRPAFDLLCGATSLLHKQGRWCGDGELGLLVRPALAATARLDHPGAAVNDLHWLRAGPVVLVNARWLPPGGRLADLPPPCVGLVGEQVAFALLRPEDLACCSPTTLDDCLGGWLNSLPCVPAGGTLVSHLWDLVEAREAELWRDYEEVRGRVERTWQPANNAVVGPTEHLIVEPTARLEPFVLVDTSKGPVLIDRDVVVHSFSRIAGPCYVGPGSHVCGAKLRASTLGPACRVGGEVEASTLQGHVNKYHDGFLGHSYVGEWVNLAAGTQTSDLRNDYAAVSVAVDGRRVPTGLTKVGAFLGDHTKLGLGTLLNTGTVVGAFCNLLPAGRLLPREIPSFCAYWNGQLVEDGDLNGLLQTADTVMRRRGKELTPVHAALYRGVFDQTLARRREVLRRAEQRRVRRSA
jgi:UDP-N-acetylglucosamine diphosphorylase/glucosamine-1-phosphate N-acetyltransferase